MILTEEEKSKGKIKKLIKRNETLMYILKEDRNLSITEIQYNYKIAYFKRELRSAKWRYIYEYRKFKKAINEILNIITEYIETNDPSNLKKILDICNEYKGEETCKQTEKNYKK